MNPTGTIKPVFDVVHLIADVFTIAASGIAIYLFVAKRAEITAAFRLLLSYSYQTTLAELKEKLERLNEYNANEPNDLPEIRNICHEIAGQIRGNPKILAAAPNLAQKVENTAAMKRLTEPLKRSLVSEVREVLKNMNVSSIEDLLGK